MTDGIDGKRDFFISFTGDDRAWARWLARVLGEEGYSFWFQDQDFAGSIPRSIAEAHLQSERTILILSEAYVRSGYCRSEWEMRYQQDPGGSRDLLLLFRVGPYALDPLLGRIAYHDLFTCHEAAARELVCHRLRKAVEPSHKILLGKAAFPGRQSIDAPFPVPPHNLPQPNRGFVSRTAELEELERALATSGRSAITQPRAITGLGGIGKTQLALHYAYAHLGDYDLIRRLRAEEPATLAADYLSLAPVLGLDPKTPDQASLIAAIRTGLERKSRWLLIFDNAQGPTSLQNYLPPTGTGHVLITSRERHWRGIAQPLELELLPLADAVMLLIGSSPDRGRRAEAERLADELGRLPLALAQARAYLDELAIDIPTYRERLSSSRRRVLARSAEEAEYSHSVATVWQASIEAAEGRCPAARSLLELLAFLAPDAIPRGLLGAKPEALPESLRDPAERDEAIGALHRFFLLSAAPETLTIHRLVQAVTRDGLDTATAMDRVEAAVRLVNAALPNLPKDYFKWPMLDPSQWPAMVVILPHVFAATEAAERLGAGLEVVAAILKGAALYYDARTSFKEAEALLERAVAIAEKKFGPEHPDVGILLDNLGAVYLNDLRHCKKAEPLLERAVAIAEKNFGPEHPALITRLTKLAGCREHAKAEPLLERAVAIAERTVDPEVGPAFAQSLGQLASIYQATGRDAKAELFKRRALHIQEQAFGPEHPKVVSMLDSLAFLYKCTGRYAEAEPFHQRALHIQEQAFGPEHFDVAMALHNLAGIYLATGRDAEAEPLFRRTLMILDKMILDKKIIDTSLNYFIDFESYADLVDRLGRIEEAAALRVRAKAGSPVSKAFHNMHLLRRSS